MKLNRFVFIFLLFIISNTFAMDKVIKKTAIVNAPVDSVWNAWITNEGAKTFFASDCKIEARVGGAYELYFDTEAENGSRGSEGCTIEQIEPLMLLVFTWNAPPHLSNVRKEHTRVTVHFEPVSKNETRVTLEHTGWKEGKEWQKAYEYFNAVWGQVVLARLQYRFVNGPIDWDNPPPM